MLNDAQGFKKVFLATGYTDLRRGMEGLAAIINGKYVNAVPLYRMEQEFIR